MWRKRTPPLGLDALAPGILSKAPFPSPHGGRLMAGIGVFTFIAPAVDGAEHPGVATLANGSVSVISPKGGLCGCGRRRRRHVLRNIRSRARTAPPT